MADETKIIKEALKSEITPLLLMLRDAIEAGSANKDLIERGHAILQKIADKDSLHGLELTLNAERIPVLKGKDGKTPQKGVDYFTEEEKKTWLELVTPKKDVDYRDGKDGAPGKDAKAPVAGIDFFTPIEREAMASEILDRATPRKGIHYRDGDDGKPGKDGTVVVKTPSAEEIRYLLESLTGRSRLSASAIQGLEPIIERLIQAAGPMYVGGTGSAAGSAAPSTAVAFAGSAELSITSPNGVTQTFAFGHAPKLIMWNGQFQFSGVDYNPSGNSITFTGSNIPVTGDKIVNVYA